jgi:hypothetical protein
MKKKKVDSVYLWLVTAFLSVVVLISCANPLQDSESGGVVDPRNLELTYKKLATVGYMGGKVLYAVNDNGSVDTSISHLQQGVIVGVRTGQVKVIDYGMTTETTGKSGVFVENPEAPITYGYIKIEAVNEDSVTFVYQRFSNMGNLPFSPETFTVRMGEEGVDINHDGALDISYEELDIYRPGIGIDSRYLNFISSQSRLNTTYFSVLPEQYSNDNYPSGLVGINPEGKWLVNRYKVTESVEIHSYDASEESSPQPAGQSNNVKGLVRGDYVIDNYSGSYYSFKGTRQVASSTSVDTLMDDLSALAGVQMDSSAAFMGFGGPSRPVYSVITTIQEVSKFITGDIPLYMNSDSSNEKFVSFKEQLLDVFIPTYTQGKLSKDDTIDKVIEFLNTAIGETTLANQLKLMKTDDNSPVDVDLSNIAKEGERKFVNRAMLREVFREQGLAKYILPANLDSGDVTAALPLTSVQITDNFDYTYDPSDNLSEAAETAGILRASDPRAATQGYQNYLSKQKAADQEFTNNFKTLVEKDVATLLLNKLKAKIKEKKGNDTKAQQWINSLNTNNIVTKVRLGLAGTAKDTWGNVEMTVGAAVFLQMEITFNIELEFEDLLGDDLKLFEFTGVFQAGPVTFQISCPVTFNIDCKLQAGTDFFAGYTGFYGGKATAGLNYGVSYTRVQIFPEIKIFGKVITPAVYVDLPSGAYGNPYASGTSWKTTAAYFGPKESGPTTVTMQATLTPKVMIAPGIGVYGIIWGKLPGEVRLPITATVSQTVQKPVKAQFSVKGNMEFELSFVATAELTVMGFNLGKKELYNRKLIEFTTPNPFLDLSYTLQ